MEVIKYEFSPIFTKHLQNMFQYYVLHFGVGIFNSAPKWNECNKKSCRTNQPAFTHKKVHVSPKPHVAPKNWHKVSLMNWKLEHRGSPCTTRRLRGGPIVHAGNKSGAGSWTGDQQRVSAHARTLVVLKIYNPVRAYGATGFKSRRLPSRNRFNTLK